MPTFAPHLRKNKEIHYIIFMKRTEKITLKSLNKSNIWELQENDVFRLWDSADKDLNLVDNTRHYIDIIKSAFTLEELPDDKKVEKSYTKQGYKIATVKVEDGVKVKWALKKKPITRVTDLTYENIRHVSAAKVIEVIDRNFGGGWESLSQSIRDIIESGFDISTTTLPKDRLKKPGGLYDKMIKDGYEVLEIPKGLWVEAIFAKEKPEFEKPRIKYESNIDNPEDDTLREIDDSFNSPDEDDDDFDEDKLTEESYRTTFDEDPEELGLEAADVADDDYM